jgi:hypothetical protein
MARVGRGSGGRARLKGHAAPARARTQEGAGGGGAERLPACAMVASLEVAGAGTKAGCWWRPGGLCFRSGGRQWGLGARAAPALTAGGGGWARGG